jgi:hypothetical protein
MEVISVRLWEEAQNLHDTFYYNPYIYSKNTIMIKKLLRESILKQDELNRAIIRDINESFKDTKVLNNKFINESVSYLTSNNDVGFMKNLFESADMMDALLDICVLTFSSENTKLGGSIATFSLPAGWTCPFANLCLKKVARHRVMDPEKVGTSKISKKTGKEVPYKGDVQVTKGKDAEFDCYAANQEMQYDAVRANRWHNFDLLKEAGDYKGQADLIERSLKFYFDSEGKKDAVRIHESGDFYNGEYLKAWMEVARRMPNVQFYAYTKSVPYVKQMEKALAEIPNLSITLSKGGRADAQLGDVDVKESHVFNTPEEVLKAGLIVDLDDELSRAKGGKESNFALLVHGTQEKGEMSQNKMRNETFMAYWKYRKRLNRNLGKSEDYHLSEKEADQALGYIEQIKSNPEKYKSKFSKTNLDFMAKLLRYVKKYHKYNFDKELVNIIPKKYR